MPMPKFAVRAAVCTLLGAAMAAHAAIVALPLSSFSGSETVVDYGLLQTFAPIDGVSFGGVLHNFTIGGVASTDARLDGGPGVSNNVSPADIEGNIAGVLSLTFSSAQNRIGFGWALNVLTPSSVGPAALDGGSIELFDAANVSLGSLAFTGGPDPLFIGGFAGLESSLAFNRAAVSWTSSATRFAFDNLRFENVAAAAAPEPATLALAALALLGLAAARKSARSAGR